MYLNQQLNQLYHYLTMNAQLYLLILFAFYVPLTLARGRLFVSRFGKCGIDDPPCDYATDKLLTKCQNDAKCCIQNIKQVCECVKNEDGIPLHWDYTCARNHVCLYDNSLCINGGVCTANASTCDCPDKNSEGLPLYVGQFCEKKNPCLENPCYGGGKCNINLYGYHWCDCAMNDRFGQHCEKVTDCGLNATHVCPNDGDVCIPGANLVDSVRYTYARCFNWNVAMQQRLPTNAGYTCSCYNDPHCINFDGRRFEYHGTCDHVMAETCVAESEWPSDVPVFRITASHRNCMNGGVEGGIACVHQIGIEVDGDHFELQIKRNSVINVIVNGNAPDMLPYFKKSIDGDTNLIEIQAAQHRPLSQMSIMTAWGLTISATPTSINIVTSLDLTKKIAGKLCGTCGPMKFDGKEFAGAATPNKNFITTTLKSPLSPPGCETFEDGFLPYASRNKRSVDEPVFVLKNASSLCKSPEQLEIAEEKCNIINDPEGPFAPECIEKNKQRAQLYEACIMDMCVSETFYCSNLEGYAQVCGKLGPFKDWREQTGCGISCLPNQEFKKGITQTCTPSCKNKTPCSNMDSNNEKDFQEGCVCIEGFIWDSVSASCITEDQCGKTEPGFPKGFGQGEMCEFRGFKFLIGEARWDNCRKLCTCGPGRKWTCENYRSHHCGPKECRNLKACLFRNVDFPSKCDENFVKHRLVFADENADKSAYRGKRHATSEEIVGSSHDEQHSESSEEEDDEIVDDDEPHDSSESIEPEGHPGGSVHGDRDQGTSKTIKSSSEMASNVSGDAIKRTESTDDEVDSHDETNRNARGGRIHLFANKERKQGHKEDLRDLMRRVIIVVDSEDVKNCQPH